MYCRSGQTIHYFKGSESCCIHTSIGLFDLSPSTSFWTHKDLKIMSSYFSSAHQSESPSLRLIRPCKCTGSQSFVHLECLNQWWSTSSAANCTCSVCKYKYLILCRTVENRAGDGGEIRIASLLVVQVAL
jgi:hypothetical protein